MRISMKDLKARRSLSVKQKKYLEAIARHYTTDPGWDGMASNEQSTLEQMGDYETLWSDAQRYLGDIITKRLYGSKKADNEQEIARLEREEESIIKEMRVLKDKLSSLDSRYKAIKSEILRRMRS
jgi:predicted  nucleic acid-binding Zn-ribbon protein